MQESDQKMYKIKGTALVPGESRNGNKYTEQHIMQNAGKEVKLFYGDEHVSNAENVVGKVTLYQNGTSLDYEGWMINTNKHPDAVSQAQAGLLDVSITAMAESEEMIDIRNLHLVATPGVEAATAIMVESFHVDSTPQVLESELSEQCQDLCDKPKEGVPSREKMEESMMEEAIKKELSEAKEMIVESILEMNPALNKESLLVESFEVLKVRREYEKRFLKESQEKKEEAQDMPEEKKDKKMKKEQEEPAKDEEEKPEEEEEKKEESEGKAVVEPEVKKQVSESFVVDPKSGLVTMSESAYKKFNEDIRKRI